MKDEKFYIKLNFTIFIAFIIGIFIFIRLCFCTLEKAKDNFYKPTPFINIVKFIDKNTNGIFSSRIIYTDRIAITKNTKDCYWINNIEVTDQNVIDLYKYYYTFEDYSYNSKKLELLNKIITIRPEQPIWYYERTQLKDYNASVDEIINDFEKIISLMKNGQSVIDTNNLVYYGGQYNGTKKYLCDIYIDYLRYLVSHEDSSLITDEKILDIGHKALDRTELISMSNLSKFEISQMRCTLGDIYLKQHYVWGARTNYLHAILANPFDKNNHAYIKYGKLYSTDSNEWQPFYYIDSCLNSSSLSTCEDAIKKNKVAMTGLGFVPFVRLGDINFSLKDYKSAMINYEKALSELDKSSTSNQDDVSIYDYSNYKDLIRNDIYEKIKQLEIK